MIRSQKIVVAAATAVFLCQLVAVVVLSPHFGDEVDAAERYTAGAVASVPVSVSDEADNIACDTGEALTALSEKTM
jgi:hypothetical protein